MTGRLLPTGNAIDIITLPPTSPLGRPRQYTISCVDAANPFVFVKASELGLVGTESLDQLSSKVTETLMEIRANAAILMGLASSLESASLILGTPKVAIVGPPVDYTTKSGRLVEASECDVWIRTFSMGKPHPAIQMTGAVCVGAASAVPGSLVNAVYIESRTRRGVGMDGPVNIGHAGGIMSVEGESSMQDGELVVHSGTVYRTARRLMEGTVFCYA